MLKIVQYVVGYEAKVRRLNGFEQALASPEFEERYQRLIRNLDDGSIDCVNEIIRRLRVIFAANDGDVLDLYSDYEKEEILRQKNEMGKKILWLSNELFFWGGCFLPVRKYEISVFMYRYGLDHVRTLQMIGDADIIDAGGYVGDSAWLLSPLTSGNVWVFEPVAENINKIYQTIDYNLLLNVKPVHAGLGASRGSMEIQVAKSSGCATLNNRLVDESVNLEQVEIVTLDGFVKEKGVRRVGLIKTDIEGAEQMLLAGALEVIKRDRPILLISIYHNSSDFFDIKPMIEDLNLGYEFKIYHPPIKNISGETVLIAEVPMVEADINFTCDSQFSSEHRVALLKLWQYYSNLCNKNASTTIECKSKIQKRNGERVLLKENSILKTKIMRIEKEILSLKDSESYRIGRLILLPFRILKNLLKK